MDPKQIIEAAKLMRTLKDKVLCPICLDAMQDVSELSCGHKFCSDCFSQHKASQKSVTCPLCKIPIMRRSRIFKDEYLSNLGIFVSNVCDFLKTHDNKDNGVEKILEGKLDMNEFDKLIQSHNTPSTSKTKKIGSKSPSVKRILKKPENLQYDSLQINKTGKKTYSRQIKVPEQEYKILEFDDSKNRDSVLKWLTDTRNKFDRLTQTQTIISEDDHNTNVTVTVTDLPSVSQQKLNKSVNHTEMVAELYQKRRTKSVDFETRNSPRKKRFSELSVVLDNYNIEEINTEEEKVVEKAEEKVFFDIIEDEYLNKLESALQGPSKGKSNKKPVNETVTATPNSSTGWGRITEVKKTFRHPKLPKKLHVVLNVSQCSTSQKENVPVAANIEKKKKKENLSVKPKIKKSMSRSDKIMENVIKDQFNKSKETDNKKQKNDNEKSISEKQNSHVESKVETENEVFKISKNVASTKLKNSRALETKKDSNDSKSVTAPPSKAYDLHELETYLVQNMEVCTKPYDESFISDKKVNECNLSNLKKSIEVTPKKLDAQTAALQSNADNNRSSSDLDYYEATQKWNENLSKEDEVLPVMLEDEVPSLEDINQQDLTSHSTEDLLNLLTDNLQKCYHLIKSEKLLLLEQGLSNMDFIVNKIKTCKKSEKEIVPVKKNAECQTIINVVNQQAQTPNIPVHKTDKAIQAVEQKFSEEKQVQTDFNEKSNTTYGSCYTDLQESSKNNDVSKIITQKTKKALETFMDDPEMSLPRSLKQPESADSKKLKTQNDMFTCTIDNMDFDTQDIIKKNAEAKKPSHVSQKLVNSPLQSQLICTVQTGKLLRNRNSKREAELSDSDEDIKPRAKRNRFLNSDLSIEFATNTERANVQEEEKKPGLSLESDDFNYDECLDAILKKYDNPKSSESTKSDERQEKSILEKCDDIIEQVTKNVQKLTKKHESSLRIMGRSQYNKKSETDIISESESLEPIPKKAKDLKRKEVQQIQPDEPNEEPDDEFQDGMEFDDSLDDACFENIEVPVEIHPAPKPVKIISNVLLTAPKKRCKDDDLFSDDDDIVESTPPRSNFHSESQLGPIKDNEIILEKAALESCNVEFDAIPPPPGFEDTHLTERVDETDHTPQITVLNQQPLSLTPDKLDSFQQRNKPSTSKLRKFEHSTPCTDIDTEGHALTPLSPIPKEKSSNLIDSAKSFLANLTTTPKNPRSKSSLLTSTPKQKSMWNYVKSSQERSLELVSPTKPCIACTRISNSQMVTISQLANKKLATYSMTFNKDVTHMIVAVKADNSLKDYTLKFVCAVASGIWVLRLDWIRECLNQNRIVPEEPYEILDDVGGNGPKTARLTRKENPLFKGFKFYCHDQFLSATKKDIEDVILMLEGEFVSKPEELTRQDGKIGLIITEGTGTQDFNTFEEWLKLYKIATVDLEWLSRSVGRYTLLSIRPYLWCSDDDIEELRYPNYLIEKVPFSSAD